MYILIRMRYDWPEDPKQLVAVSKDRAKLELYISTDMEESGVDSDDYHIERIYSLDKEDA